MNILTAIRKKFDGSTYDPQRDGARLSSQMSRVLALMSDGRWRTIPEIAEAVGGPEPSVSARLRDLRKEQFGMRTVERRYVGNGLWEYRVERR